MHEHTTIWRVLERPHSACFFFLLLFLLLFSIFWGTLRNSKHLQEISQQCKNLKCIMRPQIYTAQSKQQPVQPRPSSASVYTIQVCSDSTPRHCNTVLGKIQALLLRAAMQTRLTAGLCHCKHICMKYCYIQVGSGPTTVHCNTAQGKMLSPLVSAMQTRLTAGL